MGVALCSGTPDLSILAVEEDARGRERGKDDVIERRAQGWDIYLKHSEALVCVFQRPAVPTEYVSYVLFSGRIKKVKERERGKSQLVQGTMM